MRRLWTIAIVMLLGIVPVAAQDSLSANPILSMLRFVSDTPDHRLYVAYGDLMAWHKGWNIPRFDSVSGLDSLEQKSRDVLRTILPEQTLAPFILGIERIETEDLRQHYGYNLFSVNRFVQAGNPTQWITILELNSDTSQIEDALKVSKDYSNLSMDDLGTLYSNANENYHGYETLQSSPTITAAFGDLNRIALLNQHMVTGQATRDVLDTLDSYSGNIPNLAGDPTYVAAVAALDEPVLDKMGELVGAVFIDQRMLSVTTQDDKEIYAVLSGEPYHLAEQFPLPEYRLVNFATFRSSDASYLIMAVVFNEGTDTNQATNTLIDRVKNFRSLKADAGLIYDSYWTLETSVDGVANGFPVSLIAMRVLDSESASEIWSWSDLIVSRNIIYLLARS